MPLDAARKILALAKAGLPIVIVGTAPNQTPGRTPADDNSLQATMSQLMQIRNVHQVAHEADVPALLLSLGIHPAADPGSPSPVLSVHRRMHQAIPIITSSTTRAWSPRRMNRPISLI
jgi:hypothetical protein